MSNYNVGQVIIHEGRRCKITELTDHTAKLVNLSPISPNDWKTLEILLMDIKEELKWITHSWNLSIALH